MIIKKEKKSPDKKAKPFIGILLFLVSIILFVITVPFGFIYAFFYKLFTKGFLGIGEYYLKIAISVDQLGNVLMQHLLNLLWIQPNGYKFGNRDETISSAIGRNKQLNTLTGFGRFIDKILDTIDPNHTLNSIDYYVEPSDQIIDKLAWIFIKNHQILSTKSKGKTKYYIPGGKRENNETDYETLTREIKEELQVELLTDTLQFIGIFEAQADSHASGVLVRMTCYAGEYSGELKADTEIEEFVWLQYKDRNKVSEVDQIIFSHLQQIGLLH